MASADVVSVRGFGNGSCIAVSVTEFSMYRLPDTGSAMTISVNGFLLDPGGGVIAVSVRVRPWLSRKTWVTFWCVIVFPLASV